MVLAGTILFAALGYAKEADAETRRVGAQRRTSLTLAVLLVAVLIPLALNTTAVLLLDGWTQAIQRAAAGWAEGIPGAEVTGVTFSSNTFRIGLRAPDAVVATDGLLEAVDEVVPSGLAIVLDTTYGEEIAVGTTARPERPPASARQVGTCGPCRPGHGLRHGGGTTHRERRTHHHEQPPPPT